jgi:hypothetical protein
VRADRLHRWPDRCAPPIRWRAIVPNLEVIVSLNKLRIVVSTSWAGCVIVVLALRTILSGAPIAPSEYFAWMFLALGPAVVSLMIVRGMSSRSVAQVLYDVERTDRTSIDAVQQRLRTMANIPPTQL